MRDYSDISTKYTYIYSILLIFKFSKFNYYIQLKHFSFVNYWLRNVAISTYA